jgi:hypothetical protein
LINTKEKEMITNSTLNVKSFAQRIKRNNSKGKQRIKNETALWRKVTYFLFISTRPVLADFRVNIYSYRNSWILKDSLLGIIVHATTVTRTKESWSKRNAPMVFVNRIWRPEV